MAGTSPAMTENDMEISDWPLFLVPPSLARRFTRPSSVGASGVATADYATAAARDAVALVSPRGDKAGRNQLLPPALLIIVEF
jgi:hypothetical protein